MTQQEKASEVLNRLFRSQKYAKFGLSENFLRQYAKKQWVGKDEPLRPEALIFEANKRALLGQYTRFLRFGAVTFRPRAKFPRE